MVRVLRVVPSPPAGNLAVLARQAMVAPVAGGAMNLLILAALSLLLLGVLWLAQVIAVRWAGEGRLWALPFRHGSDAPRVRGVMKAALGASVVTLLIVYPML